MNLLYVKETVTTAHMKLTAPGRGLPRIAAASFLVAPENPTVVRITTTRCP